MKLGHSEELCNGRDAVLYKSYRITGWHSLTSQRFPKHTSSVWWLCI